MGSAPRAVRVIFLVLGAWLAVAAVRNAFFGDFDAGPLFGRYVHDAVLVAAGCLCAARAVLVREERLAWGLIAAGILAWTFGEIYYTGVLWTAETVPVPSPADAGYLLWPALMMAGLVVLLRSRVRAIPMTLLADGFTAALSIAAVSAAIVFDTALSAASGDPLGVATTLAYPVTDLIMGGFVVGALAATGWRMDRTWALLGLGILTFWLADSLYLVQVAGGTYESSSWFDAGWWIGLTLVAAAAWQPRTETEAPREGLRLIVMPLSFATVGLGLLIYGCFADLNALAILLAAASMLAVMGRLIFTFRDNVRMLLVSRDEAHHDSLTGLLNRRALTRDLARAIPRAEDTRPVVLVLFDLDGFKLYNDTFGHPAGDALLSRLGQNLATYLDGRGTAYRMGGDEFCALFEPGEQVAAPIVAGAAVALSEHGEGFSITSSHGSIVLPLETDDAGEALRIADRRMYAQKNAGRASATRQSKDVLVRALAERNTDLSSHMHDVAGLAEQVALRLALGEDDVANVRHAAELHDVGKVAVPDEILSKPGPLTDEEFGFIRNHTLIGERIIAAAPALNEVARIVRSSHERWDGTGYPDGLAGDSIPLASRIVFVADSFDAMTSHRPYNSPRTPDEALRELRACAGSQFDPVVVEAFRAAWAEQQARSEDPVPSP
ncbi:MAG TPA: diguanylate cyclase [Thermoleophilaceae bacterium]|nr:diguanylate cyclase [Thermoleophilaceae bacterium]